MEQVGPSLDQKLGNKREGIRSTPVCEEHQMRKSTAHQAHSVKAK